jgi:hypothetical protein
MCILTLQEQTAETFVNDMKSLGFECDFSLHSLLNDIDVMLSSSRISFDDKNPSGYRHLAGIQAYIGETLKRLYGGEWQGKFIIDTPESNFYTAYLSFGEFNFYPARFLTYRLGNGEALEGTFKAYLERVLPRIIGENNPQISSPQITAIKLKSIAPMVLVALSLFVVLTIAFTDVGKQQAIINWPEIDAFKAEMRILSVHPDEGYVYNRFVAMSERIPEILSLQRKSSNYDPDFVAMLSTWKASIDTARAFNSQVPKDCETWEAVFRLTWGEDEVLWDDDTNSLWALVLQFCEVSSSLIER